MFEGFARGRIHVGEIDIAHVIGGDGPPVLLLHGYPQTLAMWARIGPALAERFTVVAADLRGYGDTSKPVCLPDRSNYSFRAMATDQASLMRALGFESFHVIGHDRGGRVAHRLALDEPGRVLSLSVLDIVPTYAMLMETSRHVAAAYWHWYFLAQPEPFPETLIGRDPDYFFEHCLVGWGKVPLDAFDPMLLQAYRTAWRNPAFVHGSCSDYRATLTVDLAHDTADIGQKVTCPSLVFWGTKGLMHELFDMEGEWENRLMRPQFATLPGGHFFPDQFPEETAARLSTFLSGVT